MTDPIANMLVQIKNAQAVSHPTAEILFSNLKYEIGKVLAKHGFINKVEKKGRKVDKVIEIFLKYEDGVPVIAGMKRVSKPGQRIYLDHQKINRVKSGYGISIVSTSKGLMSDKEARKNKLGGEILCEVW